MSEEIFTTADDKRLHCYTDPNGQRWWCIAYDHGPFCRLCQPEDEALAGCMQNVLDGNMTARQRPDGGFEFKVTDKGKQEVRRLIETYGAADDEGRDA